MAELTAQTHSHKHGNWDAEENRMDKGKEHLGKDWVSDFL